MTATQLISTLQKIINLTGSDFRITCDNGSVGCGYDSEYKEFDIHWSGEGDYVFFDSEQMTDIAKDASKTSP